MKNIYLLILLLNINLLSIAQISITSSDMPKPNDSIRMSTALNSALYDFTITDTNHNWNFNQLIASNQRSEQFMSVSSTPLIYNFYKNTNADFRQVGYGASVNGTPIPVTFTNDDVIYRFPMSYGNVDSSHSKWNVNVPSLAYVEEELYRKNTVDGWGTITTPYGTFQCIRLKSEVHQTDTINYVSTGMGFRIPQNYTEYIWLSKDLPFPILKASIPDFGGQATIEYADSARQFVGIESSTKTCAKMQVYPNPSESGFSINIQSNESNDYELIITDIQGKILFEEQVRNNYSQDFGNEFLSSGLYFVILRNTNQLQIKKLIIK